MYSPIKSTARFLAVFCLAACVKLTPDSATDPLPLPPEIETNKDLSVDPGDSFYDYCNGSWLKTHPIPAVGTIGGMYDGETAMERRLQEMRTTVPDLGRYFQLMDLMHQQPEESRAYVDAQRARFLMPTTREEAFETFGRLLMDGVNAWGIYATLPMIRLIPSDGKLLMLLSPPIEFPDGLPLPSPETLVPLSRTRAGGESAPALIVRGMGIDPANILIDSKVSAWWEALENASMDKLCQYVDQAWNSYEMFVSPEQMAHVRKTMGDVTAQVRNSLAYTLSYHLADQYMSAAFKEKYVGITREIQASLRNRIRQVDWMSETTKSNALEKLDNYALFVAYPDEWHMDCVSKLADCETLVEAVHRNNRNTVRLMKELAGGRDFFSYQIIQLMPDSNNAIIPTDLTLVNAMYSQEFNCVFIYPAMLLPPILPEHVSKAYEYAVFTIIGHEFTHGFDTEGAKYDKDGHLRNWWTVADQMAFEERREKIIQCYSHLEMDPVRAPGVYGDGNRTQTENIADLGGFLTVLDAYKLQLEKEGFHGEAYDNQLRKFYESYAHAWCVQYGDEKFSILQKSDLHSHARLRVNGVVMNTDLWYQLYDVDRNNYQYLPPERRTRIW